MAHLFWKSIIKSVETAVKRWDNYNDISKGGHHRNVVICRPPMGAMSPFTPYHILRWTTEYLWTYYLDINSELMVLMDLNTCSLQVIVVNLVICLR